MSVFDGERYHACKDWLIAVGAKASTKHRRGVALSGSKFSQWNLRLLETYFDGSMPGEEVWLSIDSHELDTIGADLGGDQGLIDAVKAGPEWRATFTSSGDKAWLGDVTRGLISQRKKALAGASGYRCPSSMNAAYLGTRPPTYLPIVAALIRTTAARDEEGFYEPFRSLLGLHESWHSAQLSEVLLALKDLEQWTQESDGRFGSFRSRTIGGHKHVGVLKAQCIVGNRDAVQLPRAFVKAAMRPGCQIGDQQYASLKQVIAASPYYSKALKEAAGDSAGNYDEPLRTRVQDLVNDWDGTLPITSKFGSGTNVVETDREERATSSELSDLELCLLPEGDDKLFWHLSFRCPPFDAEGQITLSVGDARWYFEALGATPTSGRESDPDACHAAAGALLEASGSSDSKAQRLGATLTLGDGEQERKLRDVRFNPSRARVFVPRYNDHFERMELWESALPLCGPAYILFRRSHDLNIEALLRKSLCGFKSYTSNGLPASWEIGCIPKCEMLGDADRERLPTSESQKSAARAIRLIGGRSVMQGGMRKYPAYDLPLIELDAPPGTELSGGALRIDEIVSTIPTIGKKLLTVDGSVRRFAITLPDGPQQAFSIVAQARSGEMVGSISLRIAPEFLGTPSHLRQGSIDHYGQVSLSSSGVIGFETRGGDHGGEEVTRNEPYLEVARASLGLDTATDADLQQNPIAQFLDSLSRVGAMPYPAARDQLQRLMSRGRWRRPSSLLSELRARGHLDIETNHKGHFVRVHAVPARAYRVALNSEIYEVYGIAGTISLMQWRRIFEAGSPWEAVSKPVPGISLPAIRLLALAGDEMEIQERLSYCGMELIDSPPFGNLIQWAPSISDVYGEIRDRGTESLFGAASIVYRLNPATGRLVEVVAPNYFTVGGQEAQLLCCEDWHTRSHDLYVLACRKESGQTRFCFVRDRQWGVWIATLSFGQFLKERCGRPEGAPWPLTYRRSDRAVFVPEKLRIPWSVERVLVSCSGSMPDVLNVVVGSSRELEGRRHLDMSGACQDELSVSPAYAEFIEGRWLRYQGVPINLARQVAEKLGSMLDVVDDLGSLVNRLKDSWKQN